MGKFCNVDYGSHPKIDLGVKETIEALKTSEFRLRLSAVKSGWEIKYKGEWLGVSRTDLKDNVCTSPHSWKDMQLDYFWGFVASKVIYGARLQFGCFAVIDSYSDG